MLAFVKSSDTKNEKTAGSVVRKITYNLNPPNQADSNFYGNLSRATDDVIGFIMPILSIHVDRYMNFVSQSGEQKIRTANEYAFELVMMGILWNNHSWKSLKSSVIIHKALSGLYKLRSKYPSLKDKIDVLRGFTSTIFLYKDASLEPAISLPENIRAVEHLLGYLEASGEYKQECLRMRVWISFFQSTDTNFDELRVDIIKAATIFEWLAIKYLRSYTENVSAYIRENTKRVRYQENVLFITRPVNEYHLNMIGAEIMNRALSAGFEKTEKKVVLAPACMRKYADNRCKATRSGLDIVCRSCAKDCLLNELQQTGVREGFALRIIPHSSDFSLWLKQWENNTEIGVVGVACVLNLLTGGYEMQQLNIASQCVFLEHTACQKHWQKEHNPAAIDMNRLQGILNRAEEYTAVS